VPAAAVIRGRTTVGTRRARDDDGDGDPPRLPFEPFRARDRDSPMNFVWNLLIILAADAVAIAAMLFVRRRAPDGGFFADSDRASGVFGVLSTGFAIFAGFVIFLAFTSYDQSRSGAESEALTLTQQYETAQFLPAAVRPGLTAQLTCYGRSVVGQEWPRMEDGSSGDTLNPWAVALFQSMKKANPRTAPEQSAYDKWFDQTTDREEARRDRIHGATGIMPPSLWVVLILLGLTVFAYVLFYADSGERVRAQAMMIASVTTALVVTLLAVQTLDQPYRPGIGSIKPVAMERSLRLIDQARVVTGDTGKLPCDAEGAPL
jgi:hypothetical protein